MLDTGEGLVPPFKPGERRVLIMDDDEDIVRPKDWVQRDIEKLSIEHLEDYIVELEAEITRVKADIAAKKSHANDAENLFKK